jgi:tetratricopeptide (TPR) repeat protein
MTRLALLASLLLVIGRVAQADDESLETIHARATELASGGDCDQALEAYRELDRRGVDDADVAYDRALCHARLGELGAAIVWLERATLLEPGDPEIREALRRAETNLRAMREREHHGEPLTAGESLFGTLTATLHTSTLTVLALIFQALTFAALGLLVVSRNERLRIALGLIGSFSFVLVLAMIFGIGHRLEWFEEGRLAVVVAEEATLRAGPDERAPGRRIVREGDRLRVLHVRRRYAEVRLPDDQRGFVHAREVEIIRRHGTD